MFEADDRSLIVLIDWVGFEVDERTWEAFKEIFEAAPEFLAKELRKLRVTRAIAARIKSEFVFNCGILNFLAFSLYQACRSNLFVQRACWGCCDEIRLSVEFVTVGFLGICRHLCCD